MNVALRKEACLDRLRQALRHAPAEEREDILRLVDEQLAAVGDDGDPAALDTLIAAIDFDAYAAQYPAPPMSPSPSVDTALPRANASIDIKTPVADAPVPSGAPVEKASASAVATDGSSGRRPVPLHKDRWIIFCLVAALFLPTAVAAYRLAGYPGYGRTPTLGPDANDYVTSYPRKARPRILRTGKYVAYVTYGYAIGMEPNVRLFFRYHGREWTPPLEVAAYAVLSALSWGLVGWLGRSLHRRWGRWGWGVALFSALIPGLFFIVLYGTRPYAFYSEHSYYIPMGVYYKLVNFINPPEYIGVDSFYYATPVWMAMLLGGLTVAAVVAHYATRPRPRGTIREKIR